METGNFIILLAFT